MYQEEVVGRVIDAVRQVQELSGREVGAISASTHPLRDVEGFDSLGGIEATVILSESMGQGLPDNVFVSEDGRQTLSIGEIADDLCEAMKGTMRMEALIR